jgi:hypothetical protein
VHSDETVANRTWSGFRVGDRSRGRFATPADFPRQYCSTYRGLHVRHESLGFVPRSRTTFRRPVPNPNRPIRNRVLPVSWRSGSWSSGRADAKSHSALGVREGRRAAHLGTTARHTHATTATASGLGSVWSTPTSATSVSTWRNTRRGTQACIELSAREHDASTCRMWHDAASYARIDVSYASMHRCVVRKHASMCMHRRVVRKHASMCMHRCVVRKHDASNTCTHARMHHRLSLGGGEGLTSAGRPCASRSRLWLAACCVHSVVITDVASCRTCRRGHAVWR